MMNATLRPLTWLSTTLLLALTACEAPIDGELPDDAELAAEDTDDFEDEADDESGSSGGELEEDPALEDPAFATEEDPQAITGGFQVPEGSLYAYSTVSLGNCSGVIVAPRYVLTAAHCRPFVGQQVRFYTGPLPSGPSRSVSSVSVRPGVDASMSDYTDTSGKFADVAVLRLNADVPWPSRPAELPSYFPGNNVWGTMVGRGQHDDMPNPFSELRYTWTKTYSASVADGHFLTEGSNVDPGDSGGPYYMLNPSTGRLEVQGVLYGTVWEWAMRGKYTSIRHHLSWIMDRIGYAPATWTSNRQLTGTFLTFGPMSSDRDICALACEKNASCAGVTHNALVPTTYGCMLYSSVTGSVAANGYSAGVL